MLSLKKHKDFDQENYHFLISIISSKKYGSGKKFCKCFSHLGWLRKFKHIVEKMVTLFIHTQVETHPGQISTNKEEFTMFWSYLL